MEKKLHRGRVWLVGSLTIVAIAVIAVRWRGPTLLDKATRVATVANWDLQHADYYWLTDHDVLAFKVSGGPGWTMIRHDIRTGKDELLQGPAKLFRNAYRLAGSVSLSPDGSTVLWACGGRAIGFTLDGQPLFKSRSGIARKAVTMSGEVYAAGDLRWVEVFTGAQAGIPRLTSVVIHEEHLDKQHGSSIKATTKKIIFNPPPNAPLSISTAVTRRGHLLMETGQGGSPNAAIIQTTDLDLTAGKASARTLTATVRTGYPYGVAYSPEGDRVALLLHEPGVSAGFGSIWYRLFHIMPPSSLRLSVSGLQGEGLREIGTVDYRFTTRAHSWLDNPHSIKWLPDGKRISFIHDGSLWIVPAD